jgi:hypothetical protein
MMERFKVVMMISYAHYNKEMFMDLNLELRLHERDG